MTPKSRSNLILGLCALGFSVLLVFIWIPMDTESDLIEKVRRQVIIGDSLAPSVAGLFILGGGLLLVLFERDAPRQPVPDLRNLGFVVALVSMIVVSLLVMRWAGPATIWLINLLPGQELDYRLMRDMFPWKYLGYFLGGSIMISGMIALVEGRIRGGMVLLAVMAVVAMIIIYSVPFDNLLLPPNGDV